MREVQNLESFRLPRGFRGRHAVIVQTWWIVQATLFRMSPQFCFGWRRWLLRVFGAQVGPGVKIRPSAQITYPWKVSIGKNCWIGDNAVLYSLGEISIADDVVISQKSYLCAATHDYESLAFDIVAAPIIIERKVWLATDVFIAPGVRVGEGAVIGARTSVFKDVSKGVVFAGNPGRILRKRRIERSDDA
jgi:putative colanic acid biosynthesis acetyltransferase WcaF